MKPGQQQTTPKTKQMSLLDAFPGERKEDENPFTEAEMKAGEKELKDKAVELTSSAIDKLLVILAEWDAYETARIYAQEQYNLRSELPGVDRNEVVKGYLAAKQSVMKYEARMLELLPQLTQLELESVLSGRRYAVRLPGMAMFVSIKPELANRLKKAIEAQQLKTLIKK